MSKVKRFKRSGVMPKGVPYLFNHESGKWKGIDVSAYPSLKSKVLAGAGILTKEKIRKMQRNIIIDNLQKAEFYRLSIFGQYEHARYEESEARCRLLEFERDEYERELRAAQGEVASLQEKNIDLEKQVKDLNVLYRTELERKEKAKK